MPIVNWGETYAHDLHRWLTMDTDGILRRVRMMKKPHKLAATLSVATHTYVARVVSAVRSRADFLGSAVEHDISGFITLFPATRYVDSMDLESIRHRHSAARHGATSYGLDPVVDYTWMEGRVSEHVEEVESRALEDVSRAFGVNSSLTGRTSETRPPQQIVPVTKEELRKIRFKKKPEKKRKIRFKKGGTK